MLLHGPIAQLDRYHEFADRRAWLGVANAADVLSNAGFALVGIWGLWALRHRRPHPGYLVFLAGLLSTAIGSGYYHLAPDNGRLLWDRLPIAIATAGILSAVHAETHDAPQPRWFLPALMVAGVASVLWWSITDALGAGDLRAYLLMQGSLLLIPLWQALYRSPAPERVAFGIAVGLYALAKVAEFNDPRLFEVLGIASGHTLKHLLAIAATAAITAHITKSFAAAPASR